LLLKKQKLDFINEKQKNYLLYFGYFVLEAGSAAED